LGESWPDGMVHLGGSGLCALIGGCEKIVGVWNSIRKTSRLIKNRPSHGPGTGLCRRKCAIKNVLTMEKKKKKRRRKGS